MRDPKQDAWDFKRESGGPMLRVRKDGDGHAKLWPPPPWEVYINHFNMRACRKPKEITFHRRDCRHIVKEHILALAVSREMALACGFRACKVCEP